jgi:hypothetical protein
MAGDRYYYDEEGNRQSYHRDMLQMQREQRKMESRDARLQRKEDRKNLFNDKKPIAKSSTEQKQSKADAEEPVNVIKNKEGLRALIEAINARLDAASISASCDAGGNVTVTLNL